MAGCIIHFSPKGEWYEFECILAILFIPLWPISLYLLILDLVQPKVQANKKVSQCGCTGTNSEFLYKEAKLYKTITICHVCKLPVVMVDKI